MERAEGWTPEEGTPQGAVSSPLLSNLYLDPLDHRMARQGSELVRYADDFVVLCRTAAEAERALEQVRAWTAEAGLRLHPVKTRLVDARQEGGFDFLGYHFERGQRWPRRKSLDKLKDNIRSRTRRTNGQSLPVILGNLNRTLVGWFQYFRQSHYTTFAPLDSCVRMRLRSLLRHREGRPGRQPGTDHLRWPNDFFARQGLISLVHAPAVACQSSRRYNHREPDAGNPPVRFGGRRNGHALPTPISTPC
jgi:RNA-directed DNA polymerase